MRDTVERMEWGRQQPEPWTVAGLLGYLAVLVLFLAFLTAPALVTAAVLGAAALKVAERVTWRFSSKRRRERMAARETKPGLPSG